MFETIWEFTVKPEFVEQFESAYAADGDWARLFSKFPGYRGTTLFRDTADPNKFLTIDRWDSEAQYDAMREATTDDYARLDPKFERWTVVERHVGVI